MFGHFSVILFCFSGVYCITPIIDNLDLHKLRQIWNGEILMEEWEAAMDQNIFYHENSTITTVNVARAVDDFMQKADNGDETGFGRISNIIKTAYQCTLAKYANLNAYLFVQDLRTLKAKITMALTAMRKKGILFEPESIFQNTIFLSYFKEACKNNLYHVDFDLIFRERTIRIIDKHNYVSSPSKDWYYLLEDIIEKKPFFKIKYKIYPDVFRTKFTNELDLPDVHVLNEIVCVFNEAIQLFDNFIVDKCVQHGGSFLENFRSLKKGVLNRYLKRLTDIIDIKKTESSYWALYRDYSLPIPGTSQAVNEIRASGGFVENVEFEISGLKMNLPNHKIRMEIYGHHDNERTSETILKFVECLPYHENSFDVGMVSIRDSESWMADQRSTNTDT